MNCQKEKFQLQGKISYLNCAYMSPMLKKVEKAGRKGIASKRKPYKVTVDDFFKPSEIARDIFGKIIDSNSSKRHVIIPSVSYGMANVINNLPKKGKIVVLEGQFPSNIYPWKNANGIKLEVIKAPAAQNRGESWNQELLNAINDETIAVAIGHVHWADGTLFDLEAIRAKSREKGAALIIDGTQSIGALPFSVMKFQPDAVICAGYKWLMGPYSIGMAYYGEMFDNGRPIEENWINRLDSDNFSGLVNYQDQYLDGALRYEVGEHSNFILLPMFIAALKQIHDWGPENIQNYCTELIEDPVKEIMGMGYKIEDSRYRSSHLFGIRLPKAVTIEKIQKQMKIHKVSVSYRADAIRVAPHVYNEKKDMNRLVKALKSAANES